MYRFVSTMHKSTVFMCDLFIELHAWLFECTPLL